MNSNWWAWTGDDLIPLGECMDFEQAAGVVDFMGVNYFWLFDRQSLEALGDQIKEELK